MSSLQVSFSLTIERGYGWQNDSWMSHITLKGLMGYIDDKTANNVAYNNTATGLGTGDVQSAIDVLASKAGGNTGVTPFFQLGISGSVGGGQYLRNGVGIPSNQTGQLIPGLNKIVKISVSLSQSDNNVKAFKVQYRTSVNSWADVTGATISVPGDTASYKATVTGLSINLTTDAELAVVCTSGNPQNPVVSIFITPQ